MYTSLTPIGWSQTSETKKDGIDVFLDKKKKIQQQNKTKNLNEKKKKINNTQQNKTKHNKSKNKTKAQQKTRQKHLKDFQNLINAFAGVCVAPISLC